MHANVVLEIIKNTLTPAAWDDIMLQQSKFSFVNADGTKDFDGPTLMKVLLEEIDPSSSINIELHRQSIENAKLQDFKGNISEMLKSMEHHYQVIMENGHTYNRETYRRHILSALLTGTNSFFNTKIESIKSDVEAGCGYNSDISPNSLITSAKQLYTNINARNGWNKVDPRDAQILALTTALENANTQPRTNKNTPKHRTDSEEPTVPGMDTLEVWRTKFVGDTVEKQGKTWSWCKHHKSNKYGYDGLYYHNHTTATHDEWKGNKGGKRSGPAPEANKLATEKALQISERTRTALCTNFCYSQADLDKIIEEDAPDALN